jgi:hypothetical protein
LIWDFPWRKYMRLSMVQRHDLLSDLQTWNTFFKSIVVRGFQDNEDNVPMQMGDKIWLQRQKIPKIKSVSQTISVRWNIL